MQKKLALRLILGLFAIAMLFLGYQWFKEYSKDPMALGADTAGMVAAIEFLEDGSRAVVFLPNGEKKTIPGWKAPEENSGIAWSPSGNRLFVSASRDQDAFNIYAWYPDKDRIEPRSAGSRSQSAPWFAPWLGEMAERQGLITVGGFVLEYDPKDMATRQVLPPVAKDRVQGEEGGTLGTMDALYSKLGQSFREAKWGANRDRIYSIMRRDEGEILILNNLAPKTPEEARPIPLRAGEAVQFDVNSEGLAVVAVRNWQFVDKENPPAEFVVNGRLQAPYRHELAVIGMEDNGAPIQIMLALVNDDTNVFFDPAISPDGKKVAVVIRSMDKGKESPIGLIVMPLEERGAERGTLLVSGDVSMPSWSADGSMLTYLKRTEGGKNAVYTIGADGSSERKVSDDGDYLSPRISPQTKPKSP